MNCATDTNGNGLSDISWHGTKPYEADWSYDSRILAFMVDEDVNKKTSQIYVAFNSHYEDLDFELPKIQGKKCRFKVVVWKNFPEYHFTALHGQFLIEIFRHPQHVTSPQVPVFPIKLSGN